MSLFFSPHPPPLLSICSLLCLHQCDLLQKPPGGIQWGVLWCVTSVFYTVTHLLLVPLYAEWVTVHVWHYGWVYVRLLSFNCVTSPICLDVGVWGQANPSRECVFPGYPEWPHPWKALQRIRGTHCTGKKPTNMDICFTEVQTNDCEQKKVVFSDFLSLPNGKLCDCFPRIVQHLVKK